MHRTPSSRLAMVLTSCAAAVLLAACQTPPSGDTAAQEAQTLAAQAAEFAKTSPVSVLATDEAGRGVIAYFGAPGTEQEGMRYDVQQPGGFYRVYMGRDAAGHHRVQDFYQASGTPLTSVFPVAADASLVEWDTLPLQGEVTFYRPNGQVRSVTHYQNSQLHGRDVYYNDDGSERSVFHWANDMLDGPFVAREPGTLRSVSGQAREDQIISLHATGADGAELPQDEALELLEASLMLWYQDIFN
ncbi:toxin-antitoxin system YwqK family antitoxin [Lampropedia cohaerens]|nr:hypothetical protein [Lampropedia cohaerens]